MPTTALMTFIDQGVVDLAAEEGVPGTPEARVTVWVLMGPSTTNEAVEPQVVPAVVTPSEASVSAAKSPPEGSEGLEISSIEQVLAALTAT